MDSSDNLKSVIQTFLDESTNDYQFWFIAAAKQGKLQTMKELIDKKEKGEIDFDTSKTFKKALIVAIEDMNEGCIEFLLERVDKDCIGLKLLREKYEIILEDGNEKFLKIFEKHLLRFISFVNIKYDKVVMNVFKKCKDDVEECQRRIYLVLSTIDFGDEKTSSRYFEVFARGPLPILKNFIDFVEKRSVGGVMRKDNYQKLMRGAISEKNTRNIAYLFSLENKYTEALFEEIKPFFIKCIRTGDVKIVQCFISLCDDKKILAIKELSHNDVSTLYNEKMLDYLLSLKHLGININLNFEKLIYLCCDTGNVLLFDHIMTLDEYQPIKHISSRAFSQSKFDMFVKILELRKRGLDINSLINRMIPKCYVVGLCDKIIEIVRLANKGEICLSDDFIDKMLQRIEFFDNSKIAVTLKSLFSLLDKGITISTSVLNDTLRLLVNRVYINNNSCKEVLTTIFGLYKRNYPIDFKCLLNNKYIYSKTKEVIISYCEENGIECE